MVIGEAFCYVPEEHNSVFLGAAEGEHPASFAEIGTLKTKLKDFQVQKAQLQKKLKTAETACKKQTEEFQVEKKQLQTKVKTAETACKTQKDGIKKETDKVESRIDFVKKDIKLAEKQKDLEQKQAKKFGDGKDNEMPSGLCLAALCLAQTRRQTFL